MYILFVLQNNFTIKTSSYKTTTREIQERTMDILSNSISYNDIESQEVIEPIYLYNKPMKIKTKIGHDLNLNGRYICVLVHQQWLYFQIISETNTTFSVLRLQPDNVIPNVFYLTDTKNKFNGLINDGAFTKGRNIYLF